MAMAERALFRLMAWLGPSFPVGAYTYSHGLETAVEEGRVTDRTTLAGWLDDLLRHGSARNDALLLTAAWQATCAEDTARLHEVREIGAALHATAELKLESTQQGAAFREAIRKSWPAPGIEHLSDDASPLAYPVAVGVTAAAHGLPLRPVLHAYLHAFAANLVSAGVRLIPLGQSDGQRTLADLEGAVAATAEAAEEGTLDDLGSCSFTADLCSMRHETQYTRLFRS
ncbi:MAG: urease accessory protein UreF [Pseudomonadota bacterium]